MAESPHQPPRLLDVTVVPRVDAEVRVEPDGAYSLTWSETDRDGGIVLVQVVLTSAAVTRLIETLAALTPALVGSA